MQRNGREYLLPEVRQVLINNQYFDKPCIQHLDEIFIFKNLRSDFEYRFGLAILFELLVQCDKMLVIAARFAYVNLLAGKVLFGIDCWRRWTGYNDFTDTF